MNDHPPCRSCGAPLETTVVDLGVSPLANSYVSATQTHRAEPFYPLHALVCGVCFLVQVEAFESAENIFSDYAYFSSYSDSWLEHSRAYAGRASERLRLDENAFVVEAASNDGYLLQYFKGRGIRVLGVEPAKNVAQTAIARGIPTESVFLGVGTAEALAQREGRADLVIANNVIAHVPDVHDFFGGLKALLAPHGTLTVEFPHLVKLLELVQFDTIYHEHFSYYSLFALEHLLSKLGLQAYDVDTLPTHGGSLRVWIGHRDAGREPSESLRALRGEERAFGIDRLDVYRAFAPRVAARKREVLRFLIDAAESGKQVAGYGAPAKGNTLLNYCGVRTDLIAYTVDRNPHKQNTLLPGTRIPVFEPERYRATKPDYVFILPWNIKDEIVEQMAFVREWGGRFVVSMPTLQIL